MNKRRRFIAKRRRAGVRRSERELAREAAYNSTRPRRRLSVPRSWGALVPLEETRGHSRAARMARETGLCWRYLSLPNGGREVLYGQPAWDPTDYSRDFTWHGICRDG